jgi:SAM-dependent methyltransferase
MTTEPLKLRPIHPFPARMAPSIALDELPVAGKRPLRVLDPMSGSGTTLVIARARGHEALGFDTDPLALTIGKTWCADIDGDAVRGAALRAFEEASCRWRFIAQRDAYPANGDEETRQFARYWFDLTNRRQLRALAQAIAHQRGEAIRSALWCGFSKLIIAKARGASWAMDLSHSRPHKVLDRPPFRPIPNFAKAVEGVIEHSPFSVAEGKLPKATVRRGDARKLPLEDSSIDVVITSPPYLNAIDYIRCNKFSLIWMGHRIGALRELRSSNIGSEVSAGADVKAKKIAGVLKAMGKVDELGPKIQGMLARYVTDMDLVLGEIARVLTPKGRAILVIGDCTMRGVFVSNSKGLLKLAEAHGLKRCGIRARPLPDNRRYLPPPSHDRSGKRLQSRMREEIVVTLCAA